MQAMIFAAGLGTRLENETLSKPKALVEIGGLPLLQRAIEKLKNEGVKEIVVNVHHFSELIISFLCETDFGIPIHISNETEKLLDTGGGLKNAVRFFKKDTPILLYNVDILSNLNLNILLAEHKKTGALATLVVRNRETQRYLKFDSEQKLVGWINKKNGETKIANPGSFSNSVEMAFSGIHIVQPQIFDLMPKKNKFSIIDLYLELAKTNSINGFFDNSDLWMDVGKKGQLETARKMFGN